MAVLENKERICRGSGPNFWRSIYIRELPLTFNCWGSGPQWRNVKVPVEPLHASVLHVVPVLLCHTSRLPLLTSDLCGGVCLGPGAQVLIQGDVIHAIIGIMKVPAQKAPIRPHVAAHHSLEGRESTTFGAETREFEPLPKIISDAQRHLVSQIPQSDSLPPDGDSADQCHESQPSHGLPIPTNYAGSGGFWEILVWDYCTRLYCALRPPPGAALDKGPPTHISQRPAGCTSSLGSHRA
ncbi:uncharacterized protein LOC116587534 [Mustela erminea]|uniref:uncharacterized protein LOC116587534 n=1 Tax=Mustela erminea TaxID=36723 RepID=UPI00138700F3|nr:uncharacterized protein LOC116587534 [Mustela erminea]